MAGPWEAYQETGPWSQFSAAQSAPDIGPEISGGVTDAIKSAAASVGDYLNPFSEARHTSYASQAAAPLGEALQQNIGQIAGTGQALATPLTAPGNIATAIAAPPIAHGFQAINQAAGVDLPYDTAKQQTETALMGIRPAGASPTGPRMTAPKTPSIADLKQSYKDVVNSPAVKNAAIDPTEVNALAGQIQNQRVGEGFRPSQGSAPGTFAELNRMVPGANVKSVGVEDLLSARRALNITAGERNSIGQFTPDALAAKKSIGQLDDFIEKFVPEMKGANANYAAAKAAEILDYKSMKAAHRAAKTGSGSNIENTMRQEIDKIPTRGLTPSEQAAANQIVEGTVTRNLLRKVGKLGFSDGLTLMYHAGLAGPTGGANLPIGAAATVARKVGERMTKNEIAALNRAIRGRSPLAQSMSPQVAPAPILGGLLGAPRPSLPFFPSVIPAYADQNKRP